MARRGAVPAAHRKKPGAATRRPLALKQIDQNTATNVAAMADRVTTANGRITQKRYNMLTPMKHGKSH